MAIQWFRRIKLKPVISAKNQQRTRRFGYSNSAVALIKQLDKNYSFKAFGRFKGTKQAIQLLSFSQVKTCKYFSQIESHSLESSDKLKVILQILQLESPSRQFSYVKSHQVTEFNQVKSQSVDSSADSSLDSSGESQEIEVKSC